jgi:hypothetical protein
MFAIFAVLIHLGITAWRNISGKERWTLTKTAGYSIIVALLAVLAMSVVVILF